MPSSPKVFFSTANASSRRSGALRRLFPTPAFSAACLLFGLAGFLSAALVALSPTAPARSRCPGSLRPLSVSVAWDRRPGDGAGSAELPASFATGSRGRHKVMAFVGIFTGFSSIGRRRALRRTWLPSDRQGLLRLEEATGLAFRFVIGKSNSKNKMAALQREVEEYDDFLLLDLHEEYSRLPYKTLAFFKAAYALFDSDFYVKADDDIYLRRDRLSLLLAKERSHPQTYIGRMKKGPVFTDPKLKWYDPQSFLLGSEYFLHAYGPIYALSADVVASLVALRNNRSERTLSLSFHTNFINFSIQNKFDLEKGMMDCLYAKCTPCVTDCVMAELEKLGQKFRVALRIAKDPRFQILACAHKGTYADDCIVERVTQHKCYIVATCDRDLKRRIRKIPGVPIMYITRHQYSIERLPEATIGGAPRI